MLMTFCEGRRLANEIPKNVSINTFMFIDDLFVSQVDEDTLWFGISKLMN